LPEVDARRIDAHRFDRALAHEPPRCIGMQSRKMQLRHGALPFLVSPKISFGVRPMPRESRVQQNNGAFRDLSMLLLPRFQVSNADQVIRIPLRFGGKIHHHRSPRKLFDRKLVHGLPPLRKVNRRINVRAAVFRRAITVGRIEVSTGRVPMELTFKRELLRRGPEDRIRRKVVRQVNPLAFAKRNVRCERSKQTNQQKKTTPSRYRFHLGKLAAFCEGNNWSPN
jgi:hypothetical protein